MGWGFQEYKTYYVPGRQEVMKGKTGIRGLRENYEETSDTSSKIQGLKGYQRDGG